MVQSTNLSISANAQMYEEIYSSALKLLYQHSPEKTYATIVKEAMGLIKAKYGSLFLFQDGELKRVFTSHDSLKEVVPRRKGNTWKTYTQHKPYLLPSKRILKAHPEFHKFRIGSDMGIPLVYDEKTFGVLSVLSPESTSFSANDMKTLQLFSPLASLALRNTDLYSRISTSLREQDLFISLAAHELKTPLTTISIYSQLLMNENSGNDASSQFKQKMFHEIERLKKLINELLQVSQIKRGRLQYEMKKCDIYDVVEQSVYNFQSADKAHRIKFACKEKTPLYIKGDRDKLTQVITNLLTNAAKFSPKGSIIKVTVAKDVAALKVTVKDHGIGIDKKDLEKIFERFYKVSMHKKEGLGLGLFLVKNIIDFHKGTIDIVSKVNKGTTFTVSLPPYAKR